MTNSVPDRWLEYKAFGDVIKGTKILAFKVPLKDAIARNLQPEQRFTTAILLQAFPHLKYIVDLTNTCRYYDKKEFTNAGVKYEKIAIPGRKIPPMDIIKKFFKVMDDFTTECGEGEIIGIHCTHGINRTGYLICRYLTQQLGWEIQESLKAFGEARGYPVERDVYLAALQEVQRGERIDTSKVVLTPNSTVVAPTRMSPSRIRSLKNSAGRPGGQYPMPRHFVNGRPQRFAGPPPGFVPIPPPLGIPPRPPIPPILPIPPPYRSRLRHRPPSMRQAMPPPTPPRLGFPYPGFPPRMPSSPRMTGPSRLPAGPTARLPPLKMPPPPPPLPPPLPPSSRATKQLQGQKKQQSRNRMMERRLNIRMGRNGLGNSRIIPKARKEQDFTIDTFEENLLTQPRRQTREYFNQTK